MVIPAANRVHGRDRRGRVRAAAGRILRQKDDRSRAADRAVAHGRLRPGRPPQGGGDGGYVAVMVAGLVVAVMAAIGLLVDGSIALAAHRQANNEAEQAARAAGQALDLAAYTTGAGQPALDPAAARQAAAAYLAGTGNAHTVEVTGPAEVTVTVTVVRRTRLLWMVGTETITATGTGRSTQLFGAG